MKRQQFCILYRLILFRFPGKPPIHFSGVIALKLVLYFIVSPRSVFFHRKMLFCVLEVSRYRIKAKVIGSILVQSFVVQTLITLTVIVINHLKTEHGADFIVIFT